MASALVDYFLRIPGIEGESTDSEFAGSMQIGGWRWSEENSGRWGFGQGGGAGKVQMGDFVFEMLTNKASPKLFLCCAKGEHIPTAQLICRKSGNGQQQFLTITFTDGLVSSYVTRGNQSKVPMMQAQGSGTGQQSAGTQTFAYVTNGFDPVLPIDEITVNFAKIEFEYREQRDDGSMGAVVKAGYDLKLNAAV